MNQYRYLPTYSIKIFPMKIVSERNEECIVFTKYLSIKMFQSPSLCICGWFLV